MTLDEVAGRLHGAKSRTIDGCPGVEAICPCHDDHNPSLHVWQAANGWVNAKCRSCGAGNEEVGAAIGLEKRDWRWEESTQKNGKSNRLPLVCEDDYLRADGSYVFTKQRYGRGAGKSFMQVVKDRPGGDVVSWSLKELSTEDKQTLFKLPELVKAVADGRMIHICENEEGVKAAMRAGEAATCQPGGAESASDGRIKWTRAHSKLLIGSPKVVWADRDAVGEYYAAMVARSLLEADPNSDVQIVQSATGGEKDGADDHFGAGFHWMEAIPRDDLLQAIPDRPRKSAAEHLEARAEAIADQLEGRDRPRVCINGRQARDIADQVFSAIVNRNDPPVLFFRNGSLCQVQRHDKKAFKIIDCQSHDLRMIASRACDFFRVTKEGDETECVPPDRIEGDIKALKPWDGIPELGVLSQCPSLRPDGSFATEIGYDAATQTYITQGPWPVWDDADGRPLAYLRDELLGDFCFEDESSAANALGLIIVPFLRGVIDGPTPIHYVDAPVPGSGKTKLVRACLYAACGKVPLTSLPVREEEVKKSITSYLLEGLQAVFWDNVDRKIDSATFATATTSERYHDRALGTNTVIDVPIKCIWAVTCNNGELNKDIARRSVWIRLNPRRSDPENRTGFKHWPIEAFCRANRPKLVAACCAAIKEWVDAGRPLMKGKQMGSYESYGEIVGGVLAVGGVTAFLGNRTELAAHTDIESAGWAEFYEAVHSQFHGQLWTVADVFEIAESIDELGYVIGERGEKGRVLRFGRAISRRKDHIVGRIEIVRGSRRVKNSASYFTVNRYQPGDPEFDAFAEEPAEPLLAVGESSPGYRFWGNE